MYATYATVSRFWVRGVLVLLLFVLPSVLNAQDAAETVFWTSVECESKLQVQAYLETYPTGAYVAEAQARLEGQLGLDRAARILVQRGLASLDYAVGVADGLFGPARAALRRRSDSGRERKVLRRQGIWRGSRRTR